jgi:hypothetical protein
LQDRKVGDEYGERRTAIGGVWRPVGPIERHSHQPQMQRHIIIGWLPSAQERRRVVGVDRVHNSLGAPRDVTGCLSARVAAVLPRAHSTACDAEQEERAAETRGAEALYGALPLSYCPHE